MIITREEFKELVELNQEIWEDFKELSEYFNEDLIGEVIFKVMSWVEYKTGLALENEDFDILSDLYMYGKVAINIEQNENGEYEYEETADLDKIYDYYFEKPGAEEN